MTQPAPYYRAHLFFCTHRRPEDFNRRGCGHFEAEAMAKALKAVVKARGLSKDVRVNLAGCLHRCRHEPVLVIYPEGTWYGFTSEADLLEILDSHVVGGQPVARLRLPERGEEPPAQHQTPK
ncbi:MAG: (2Fe-2S) ferredoxin domain-containing protein [Rhodospirillaceae bacterium]